MDPNALFETVLHETLVSPRWRELTVDLALIRGAVRRVFPADSGLSDEDVQRIAGVALELYRTERGGPSDEVRDLPPIPDDDVEEALVSSGPTVSADVADESLGTVAATDNDYDLDDSFIDDGVSCGVVGGLALTSSRKMFSMSCEDSDDVASLRST